MSKQLTFPGQIKATAIHPDGRKQELIYGHYEAVMIVKENGHDVNRTKELHAARYPVTNVELDDGVKLVFHKPFYTIEKEAGND